MVDLDKFICSLIKHTGNIREALKEQGLEYKDGALKPIEKEGKPVIIDAGFGSLTVHFNEEEMEAFKEGLKKKPDKVEPKFKVGQTIRKENFNDGFTIVKIDNGFYYNNMGDYFPFTDQNNWELVEQKPTGWSKEDDNTLLDTINILRSYGRCSTDRKLWLLSLKDRVQPQTKQEILEKLEEWLDEYVSDLADVDTASLICSFTNYLDGKSPKSLRPQNKQLYWTEEEIEPIISDYLRGAEHYGGMIGRLRCLKPQNTWKPSEEQLISLSEAINDYDKRGIFASTLRGLFEQLKKL